MAVITEREFGACYNLGKQVYENEISNQDAFAELVDKYKMNEDSAKMYINFFLHLMRGQRFVPAISQDGLRYYLKNVLSDYGKEQLEIFLEGLKGHILYCQSKGESKKSFCDLYNKYSKEIGLSQSL